MIAILPDTAWLEFRGKPKAVGQNQTTHRALVADHTGAQHKCYVKASPPGFPMVVAESIAYMLATALDLPRPKFAALLHLPVQRLSQQMRLDQHWMGYSHVLAFCSSTVDGKHLTGLWRWLSKMRSAAAFRREEVARIAAFDMWVENQDRHAQNLLQTRSGQFVPIDNELILYTLLWLSNGFTYQHNSLHEQAKQVLKAPGFAKFESAMMVAAQQHQQAFVSASPDITQFIAMLSPDPIRGAAIATQVSGFLNQRCAGNWLASHLGRIV